MTCFIEIKNQIITNLNKTIEKLKDEVKVIKQILKSPHLYSKFNQYVNKKLDYETLKNGVDRNRSVEPKKTNYSMFDSLDVNEWADITTVPIKKLDSGSKNNQSEVLTNKIIRKRVKERMSASTETFRSDSTK